MIIKHESFSNLYNVDSKIFNKLLDGVSKVNTFINRIDKLSTAYLTYGYSDKKTANGIETGDNKMKGDIFEIFAESFLKIAGTHPTIGVYGYKPIHSTEDNGVDGIGLGIDGKPLTVQVKFRSDSTMELIAEDLKQFGFQSIVNYDVDKTTKTNMVLFTCGKGMHWHTEHDVFLDRIRTIGIDILEYTTNNNIPFWKSLADMIENTVIASYNQTIIDKFTKIKI